jgi:hypothetical protein
VRAGYAALLAALLALPAACGTAEVQDLSRFSLHSPTVILESQGTDQVLVAVYSDGQIQGSAAFADVEPSLQSMVQQRTLLDHPQLALWRERLAHMRDLAGNPAARPDQVASSGSELPFQAAVDDAVLAHVDGVPARAALALDHRDRLRVSRSVSFQLLEMALADQDLRDDRLAVWMHSFIHHNNAHAMAALAVDPSAGERTATAGLLALDRFSATHRVELYGLFAEKLAVRPDRAEVLVDSLALLPRWRRGIAASQLLALPDGSPLLHLSLTRRLDEIPEPDRLELLLAVVRGPHFAGPVQTASIRAAWNLADRGVRTAMEAIADAPRLEPEAREMLIR